MIFYKILSLKRHSENKKYAVIGIGSLLLAIMPH